MSLREWMCMLATLIVILIFGAAIAFGHDPAGHGAYSDWYINQYQEPIAVNVAPSKCCGDIDERGGDAHFVDVISAGNGYWVNVEGYGWLAYTKPVNPYYRNPTGHNIAWYTIGDDGMPYFICLRLSEGT